MQLSKEVPPKHLQTEPGQSWGLKKQNHLEAGGDGFKVSTQEQNPNILNPEKI